MDESLTVRNNHTSPRAVPLHETEAMAPTASAKFKKGPCSSRAGRGEGGCTTLFSKEQDFALLPL